MASGEKAVLVLGATGATGSLVVSQLLDRSYAVRVVVRNKSRLPPKVLEHKKLSVIEASVLDLTQQELQDAVHGTSAVVSCLGHNMNFKGLFGAPRDLCTETTRRVHRAINQTCHTEEVPTPKFILMNTVGVNNAALPETRTWGEKVTLSILRNVIPPHADNEQAAAYLYHQVPAPAATDKSEYKGMEWVSVRPDTLIDNDVVSSYDISNSPATTIFDGKPTSRINVAHFMVELVDDQALWEKWVFQMPVITNTPIPSSDTKN